MRDDEAKGALMVAKLFRNMLLVSVAVLGAVPALAQDTTVTTRVDKLEKEMRAVQRKVFPGGAGMTLEPQVAAPAPVAVGVPASNPVADLTARVDSLEQQLSQMTGQIEQQGYRIKKIEESIAAQKAAADAAAIAPAAPVVQATTLPVVQGAAPAKPASPVKPTVPTTAAVKSPAPVVPVTTSSVPTRSSTGDAAEDGYLQGYDLWEAKDYAGAQKVLTDVVKKYPQHKRYSYAQNLLGRAYLDEGKAVTAAKVFLENYRTAPKGDRAADSLYFLGVSLIQLKKLPDACKSFDELDAVYGPSLRDFVKQRLPAARKEAQCAG